jgi:hypothetical protein
MAVTTAAKNFGLDGILQSTLTVSLHTADPGINGANELTGGGYSRAAVTFAPASSARSANSSAALWTNLPACTVTHVGLWRGSTFLFGASLSQARTVTAGDALVLDASSWVVQMS